MGSTEDGQSRGRWERVDEEGVLTVRLYRGLEDGRSVAVESPERLADR